jgi:hypothetical protein
VTIYSLLCLVLRSSVIQNQPARWKGGDASDFAGHLRSSLRAATPSLLLQKPFLFAEMASEHECAYSGNAR